MNTHPEPTPITPLELSQWLDNRENKSFLLLDVREEDEYHICHIRGSRLVPLSLFPMEISNPESLPIVVYCHHGVRSFHAGQYLLRSGHSTVYNLEGGIEAWACEVEPEMARY